MPPGHDLRCLTCRDRRLEEREHSGRLNATWGVFYVKTRRPVDPANQVDTLPDHHKRPRGNSMHWCGFFSGEPAVIRRTCRIEYRRYTRTDQA